METTMSKSLGTTSAVAGSSESACTLSRKAKRRLRHSSEKGTAPTIEPLQVDVIEEVTRIQSREDIEIYTCYVCLEDYPKAKGVLSCYVHFFCNDCAVDAFTYAVTTMDLFPAKCCTPISRKLAQNLLDADILARYVGKAQEYYLSPVLRTYCVNSKCGAFIPLQNFDNNYSYYTIGQCECGTYTCVGCKQGWEENHVCKRSPNAREKPEWLPQYSEEFRVKMCPGEGCNIWIEHKEACNHMTCIHCHHEFCFICLLPWGGFHQECPEYKDPPEGYDEDGFERSDRGLHVYDGYDRQGYNQLGLDKFGQSRATIGGTSHEDNQEDLEDDDDDLPAFDPGELTIPADDWPPLQPTAEQEAAFNDPIEGGWGEAYGAHSEHANNEYDEEEDEDQSQQLPHQEQYVPPLPFEQLLYCNHSWKSTYNRLGNGTCVICDFYMSDFCYDCTTCRVHVCEWCSGGFEERSDRYVPLHMQLAPIFDWAEHGIPHKRDGCDAWKRMQEDDTDWGIDTMFDAAEQELHATQPFMYHDFGLELTFELAEKEARMEYWIVEEENVGAKGRGFTMRLRLDTNPYAPLFWDED